MKALWAPALPSGATGLLSYYVRNVSPLNIAGCRLWLDSADKTSMSVTGSSVISWTDKSGSGNNATQAIAASQPIIITSGVINRQSAIVCINTATGLFLATAATIFNGGTFSFISAIGTHNSNGSAFFGNRNTGSGWNYNWQNPNYSFLCTGGVNLAVSGAQKTKHIEFLTRISTTSSLWINSTNSNSTTSTYTGTVTLGFAIGKGGVGATGTQGNSNANFYEIIGYALDKTTSRTGMETNLNTFYSIY
jgi:hypothetical protein